MWIGMCAVLLCATEPSSAEPVDPVVAVQHERNFTLLLSAAIAAGVAIVTAGVQMRIARSNQRHAAKREDTNRRIDIYCGSVEALVHQRFGYDWGSPPPTDLATATLKLYLVGSKRVRDIMADVSRLHVNVRTIEVLQDTDQRTKAERCAKLLGRAEAPRDPAERGKLYRIYLMELIEEAINTMKEDVGGS